MLSKHLLTNRNGNRFEKSFDYTPIKLSFTLYRRLFRLVLTSDSTSNTAAKNEKELSLIEIVSARNSLKLPRISATVYSARRPGFYIINGFFLNFMITVVSLAVFAIDTKTPHFRLQTTFTLLLTAISLKWVILNRLLLFY